MEKITKREMLEVLLENRKNKKVEVNKCYKYVPMEMVNRYYENGDRNTFIRIALGAICVNYTH